MWWGHCQLGLETGKGGGVAIGITLQLWRQEAGSTYTLQTEQTYTARTRNAESYVFMASPSMPVASGNAFGCYVPGSSGLRMVIVTDI